MSLIRSLALVALLGLAPAPLLAEGMATAQAIHLGPLVLSGGFSRATLPNAPVAGGFLTIENTGIEDDTLVSATSPVAGRMEVHEMAMENDVMKMRELADGLQVPAGETVTLKPGGFHIMFFDLKQPFREGDTVMVTLTFAKAGSVEVPLTVGAPNARSAGMEHGKMHGAQATHGADHAAPSAFDQAAVHGDQARIEGLLRATFETPEKPLSLDPVLIAGDRAVVGWVQGDMGGRALLERNAEGLWHVALCAGDGLKGQANMEAMGIPAAQAATLAAAQATAEAALSSETVARLDSFGEPVRFD